MGLLARELLGAHKGVHRGVWVGSWALSALAIVNGWMRWVSLPLAVSVGSWCVCFGLSGKVLEPLLTDKDNGLLRAWAKGVMFLGGFVMSVYLAHWIVIRIFVEPMQPFVVRTLGTGCCALLADTALAFVISVGVAYATRKVGWVWGWRRSRWEREV